MRLACENLRFCHFASRELELPAIRFSFRQRQDISPTVLRSNSFKGIKHEANKYPRHRTTTQDNGNSITLGLHCW